MKKLLIIGIALFSIALFSYFLKQQKISNKPGNQEISASQKLLTNAYFTIPEGTTTININSETGVTVEYTDGDVGFEERGTVTLFENYVRSVADKRYVAVVAVDRGGSGTEMYLTVFTPEGTGYKSIASVFLGDRVAIDTLSVASNNDVFVAYREHKSDQPMAEKPTVLIEKTFTYQELIVQGRT